MWRIYRFNVYFRYRQNKTDAHELERKGQKIRKFEIYTFLDDSANIGKLISDQDTNACNYIDAEMVSMSA
jgi:hypothetical protein